MNPPRFPDTGSPVYTLMLVAAIGLSAAYWFRISKSDGRLPLIYLGGLAGAFIGAKLAYLFAEGWLHLDHPRRAALWLTGKSVMGALPGGWLGVELAKKSLGYRQATGDRFALILPLPLLLGRLGCLHAGCCPGFAFPGGRWPAVPVEIAFLALMLAVLLILRGRKALPGQHFHLYLIAYGTFRFVHEFLRATPKPVLGLSGYQWIAAATVAAAVLAWRKRSRKLNNRAPVPSEAA